MDPARKRILEIIHRWAVALAFWTVLLCCAPACLAYSVRTHEALVDLAWNESIRPFLLSRFPHATDEQLREAYAYAYGGSAIQDLGYYPFGHRFFSDLTHYVRSGDFVTNLFREARTLNELAFASGALAHYVGDSVGHSEAINLATAVEFPDLRKRFGSRVTYDESPHGHIRTEFAFDIEELSEQAFAPTRYLRYVGLEAPRGLLERVFLRTYGFDLRQMLGRVGPALRSYRSSVRRFIPAIADAELVLHKGQFPPHPNSEAYRIFADRSERTNYHQWWKGAYKEPGIAAHLMAVLVFLVPKIGAAADLTIKIPTPQTQAWYLESVNHTIDIYNADLKLLAGSAEFALEDLNLDTGKEVRRSEYTRVDQTYSELLKRLTSGSSQFIPVGVKRDVLGFYTGLDPSTSPRGGKKVLDTMKRLAALQELKSSDRKVQTKD